ncbi:hypothetical protein RYZ26_19855 [Terasakiella sp. A23]|uniref:tetratricopeptide repeat protein n=1 Tax=Terasakiella sp. FCG-A23 TaxID=3080561 RepID=UPI0029533B47|nr:hypothetical protein [Terasakiella sp. A23]MDV7341858.1 hypothetical protein [Terasakiella sp. A23]
MLKKIFIGVIVICSVLGAIAGWNYAYQITEYSRYQDDISLRLAELEKIPYGQRSAMTHMEIANSYLILKQDQEKIISAYLAASNAGESEATYNLALLSGLGIKIEEDLPAYEALFQKAAEQGSLNAAFVIRTKGILKSPLMPLGYMDAHEKLEAAAQVGNHDASFILCAHGKEPESPIFNASNMAYCQELLERGYPPAQYLMGRLYEQNSAEFHPGIWAKTGLAKDMTKAIDLYQKAAEQSYV